LIGFFLFFSLFPCSFFSRLDQGPRAIWILIEKPGFMPLHDRDCPRANSIIRLRDNEHVIALACGTYKRGDKRKISLLDRTVTAKLIDVIAMSDIPHLSI